MTTLSETVEAVIAEYTSLSPEGFFLALEHAP